MSDDKSAENRHKFIAPTKKYGLTIQKKTLASKPQSTPTVRPCIFDVDDDEDMNEKKTTDTQAKSVFYSAGTSQTRLKKQTQIEIEKALSEDPSIFEYDSVYDEMEKDKINTEISKKSKTDSKEPKYIVGIMKAAAKRQMEYEKIQERKIQKEREEEGDLWQDKEVFVTSAYRQKIEERNRLAEEERNQDAVEALLDVRKQKDLSGFYSHLLKMKTGEMVVEEEGEKEKRVRKEEELRKKKKGYRVKNTEESSDEEQEAHPKPFKTEKDVDVYSAKMDEEPETKKPKFEVAENEVVVVEAKEEKMNVLKLSKEEKRALVFNKRTIGEKFDLEVAEYFARKCGLLQSKNYVEREN